VDPALGAQVRAAYPGPIGGKQAPPSRSCMDQVAMKGADILTCHEAVIDYATRSLYLRHNVL